MSKIRLTQNQVKQLLPYFDRVRSAAALGTPGMLVAQISWNTGDQTYWMEPGFLPHEVAKCISEKGQACPPVPAPISSADSTAHRSEKSAPGVPAAVPKEVSQVRQ